MTSNKHPLQQKYSLSLTGAQWEQLFKFLRENNAPVSTRMEESMMDLFDKIQARVIKYKETEKLKEKL